MVRVTLTGEGLASLASEHPAASVRLLLPPDPPDATLTMPIWDGNVFLLPDGRRATIRTITPRRLDADAAELELEIVDHGQGPASEWARTAVAGQPAAVSGPARGYPIPEDAERFLLAGDESALPAIGQLLEALPHDRPVSVHVEVEHPAAGTELPPHPTAQVTWHVRPSAKPPGDTLVDAVRADPLTGATRIWAAGEAAAMQRIRRHLFDERAVSRPHTWIRGYWKSGRGGDPDDD